MKKIFLNILLILVFSYSYSQNIRIFYAAPTAAMNTAFGAGNVFGFTRDSSGTTLPVLNGYRNTRITSANVARFRATAPTNLKKTYDSLTNNRSELRRKANRILTFSRGAVRTVDFLIIDDQTGLPNDAGWFFCSTPDPAVGLIAWPCATNDSIGRNNFVGHVSFGEVAAASENSFREWEATILHELSHTQMLHARNMPDCKWATNCVGIAYGGDDGHWFEELQADEQSPLDEGFGNFWALEHAPTLATMTNNFLADSTARFLLGSHSFLTGIPKMWNSPHKVAFTGTIPARNADGNRILHVPGVGDVNLVSEHIQTGAGYQLRKYKWLDVPGEFVFYNEIMFQAFVYLLHQNAFAVKDTALNKVMLISRMLSPISDHQRHRYPAKVALRYAKAMEVYASTARGQAEASSNTLVSSLFPLALYDMLAHFGRNDTDLTREFTINMYQVDGIENITQPRAMQEYLNRRNEIKRLLCPFLSNNADCRQANAAINMTGAINALLTYCKDPSRILR